ncbi:MAG: AAA family ATPase [Ruminococcus sp.]|jgi:predicted ATP-dependent endonuclease of OLD family|nr:AAA family ATPase [Ruminococcus sp.]
MINSVSFKDFRGLNNLKIPMSQVTLLTGENGVGKTSVLEGLYCLFSDTKLDVSPLSRYDKTFGVAIHPLSATPWNITAKYNYKLFWEECPTYDKNECSVVVEEENLIWSWKYYKATLDDIISEWSDVKNSPTPIDSATEFAYFEWNLKGKIFDKGKKQSLNDKFTAAQILYPDGGLYFLNNNHPLSIRMKSTCRYLDFSLIRTQPKKLSYQTSKELTKALKIINKQVKDVRLTDALSGLSVILDNDREVSLGNLGNGVVTWASILISIYDEIAKNHTKEEPILFLIDEMGAGIHYSVMLDIWKYLKDFSEQNNNIQFVFTSHNADCIRAYCEAFEDSDKANVVQLYRNVNKLIVSNEYKKQEFIDIIEGNSEVR